MGLRPIDKAMKSGRVERYRALVFPCGTEIGLEVHRSLSHSLHFELVGASSVSDHGSFTYEEYVEGLPFITDSSFDDAFVNLLREESIDLVIPAHDDVVLATARLAAQGRLSAIPVTSPLTTCEIARSKRRTYSSLAESVPTPRVFASAEDVRSSEYPVFLKPDCGQGSRGTHVASTLEELKFYLKKDPTLLILEFLPGPEYTVDCFTDRYGHVRLAAGRERSRISGGISVRSSLFIDDRLLPIAEQINQTLPFRGVWFFQVKERSSGELVLMEIASRAAGTMGLSRVRGINLPLLSAFDAVGVDVVFSPNTYQVVVDRALGSSFKSDLEYGHAYLDLDDVLLLRDGTVSVPVVSFIYQCRNRGIPVSLITRHAGNLPETLRRHALGQLL